MKHLKLNQKGITHILGLVAFMAVFAVIGGIALLITHAQTVPSSTVASTTNSNVTCRASINNPLGIGNIYNVKLKVNNNKDVYFTPRVVYKRYYGAPDRGSLYLINTGGFDMSKIAPHSSGTHSFQTTIMPNEFPVTFAFTVYWGQSTSPATSCSTSMF